MNSESRFRDLDSPGSSSESGLLQESSVSEVCNLLNAASLRRIASLERHLKEEWERNLELSVALAALSLGPDPEKESLRRDLQSLQMQLEQAEAACARWQAEAEQAIRARDEALRTASDLRGHLIGRQR